MVNSVGRYSTLIVLSCVGTLWGDLSLHLFDGNGNRLEQAAAGVPFVLEIVQKGAVDPAHKPSLNLPDAIKLTPSGVHASTINGFSTIRYKYEGSVDKEGVYTVGPAHVLNNEKREYSSSLRLVVGDKEKVEGTKERPAFLELTVDKNHVVRGERLTYSLRFYYLDETVRLNSISDVEYPGFLVSERRTNPSKGTKKIDDTVYNYIELQRTLIANKEGTLKIPAHRADFEDTGRAQSQLALFFGSFARKKKIYSNSLFIKAAPLPETDKRVAGVGVFSRVQAKVSTPVVKEGEALVLTITVEGDNSEGVEVLPLLIPDALTYYDSKTYQSDAGSKSFEYIVQGVKQGQWEIPEQTFTYFNTTKNRYETLVTEPLMISVLSGGSSRSSVRTVGQMALSVNDTINDHTQESLNLSIDQDGLWYRSSSRSIGWLLFMIVAMIMAALASGMVVYKRMLSSRAKKIHHIRAKAAFKNAQKALAVAHKHSDYEKIYGIFRQLFLDRLHNNNIASVSYFPETIGPFLGDKGLAKEQLQGWYLFVEKLLQCTFSKNVSLSRNEIEDLFDRAYAWLQLLQDIV